MRPTLEKLMITVAADGYGYFYITLQDIQITYTPMVNADGGAWGWRIDQIGRYEPFQVKDARDLFLSKGLKLSDIRRELVHTLETESVFYQLRLKEIDDVLDNEYNKDSNGATVIPIKFNN